MILRLETLQSRLLKLFEQKKFLTNRSKQLVTPVNLTRIFFLTNYLFSELLKLKTAFYESHFRHCAVIQNPNRSEKRNLWVSKSWKNLTEEKKSFLKRIQISDSCRDLTSFSSNISAKCWIVFQVWSILAICLKKNLSNRDRNLKSESFRRRKLLCFKTNERH